MKAEEDTGYKALEPPEDWSKPEEAIKKRPIIRIGFSRRAVETFAKFLASSGIILGILAIIYMIIAGVASAPGQVGMKEMPVTDDWGDGLTYYPGLVIAMICIYLIAIGTWYFNRDE
jgi:TRAP-type C4-dicarboxylate transport system permease small subunit